MTADLGNDQPETIDDESVQSREALQQHLHAVREEMEQLIRRESAEASDWQASDAVRSLQSSLRSADQSLQGDALDARMRKSIASTLRELHEQIQELRDPRQG